MPQAWIVRAGRDDEYYKIALDNGLVAIGWRRVGDLMSHTSWEEIYQIVKLSYPEASSFAIDAYTRQLYAFRTVMDVGDFVILLQGKAPDVVIGELTGGYEYRPELSGPHIHNVKWLKRDFHRGEVGVDLLDPPALTAVHHIRKRGAQDRLRRVVGALAPSRSPSPHRGARVDKEAKIATRNADTPTTSDAYQNLTKNLNYARNLASAATHFEGLGVTRFEIGDVYRAAWVQAVAALDQWVRREICERMLRLCELPGQAKPEKYQSFELTLGAHEDINAGKLTLRQALNDRLHQKLSLVTYQDPDKIRQGFAHVTDSTQLWRKVAAVISEQAGYEKVLTGVGVEKTLRDIVRRRNKIAHEYDQDPTGSSHKRKIDAVSTMRTIEFIDQVAAAITVVLNEDANASDENHREA